MSRFFFSFGLGCDIHFFFFFLLVYNKPLLWAAAGKKGGGVVGLGEGGGEGRLYIDNTYFYDTPPPQPTEIKLESMFLYLMWYIYNIKIKQRTLQHKFFFG